MKMLWVSLVLGAVCFGSEFGSAIDPLQWLQQEMDQMKIHIQKLESESAARSKITEAGRQIFTFFKMFQNFILLHHY